MTLQVKFCPIIIRLVYTTGPNDAGNLINVPLLGSGNIFESLPLGWNIWLLGHYGQAGTGTLEELLVQALVLKVMFWDFMMLLTYIVC